MMKNSFYIFLILHTHFLFAQPKSDFFFPTYDYKIYEEKQQELFKQLNLYRITDTLSILEQASLNNIQEKKQIQTGEQPLLFDFDKDGRWDLLLVQGTYFGPSSGFQFYANTQNGLEFICENAGDILEIKKTAQNIIFYYYIPIMDIGESQVLYIINLQYTQQKFLFKKVYYAQQSTLPKKLDSRLKKIKLKHKTALRLSPEIKNEGLWKDIEENEESYLLSKFIQGNIIAYYEAKAEFIVLAEKGSWLFVAFLPEYEPSKTSLSHGMENWKTTQLNAYVCGWIEK